MGTPIYRKTREVQLAAGGRQIALIFPLIDVRILGFSFIGPYWTPSWPLLDPMGPKTKHKKGNKFIKQ